MPDGRWKSKQATTLDLAKSIEGQFRVEAAKEDVWDVRRAPKINEAWAKYAKWAEQAKKSFRTEKGLWERHIGHRFGKMPMNKIRPKAVQDMLDDLGKTKVTSNLNKGQPLSPRTLQYCYTLLNRVYTWTAKQGLYKGPNPCQNITPPRFDNQVTDNLSESAARRLLETIEADQNERACLVIRFGLFAGRRLNEVLSLKFDDVDFKNKLVTFKGQNSKNGRSQTLPVNDNTMSVLERCKQIRISDLVFPCSTGKRYHSFSRTWRRIRKKAKINVRFHDLRHTFASFLASSGKVDQYTLQILLGHRSSAMTQRYSHLIDDALRRSANVADEVFSGQHK
jgi:integrase